MPSFLEDCHAIKQVYIRYCEIVDLKDFDRMVEVFTEDTVGDYTSLRPGDRRDGVRPLIERMHLNLGKGSNCGPTHHNVGNFRISVDGDTARAKVYYYALHRGLGRFEGALYSMWGQYDDELVRTADGWRVKKRLYQSMLRDGPMVTSRD